MSEDAHISLDSPKMLDLKREWDSLRETYAKTPEKISRVKKGTYDELERMQGDLLRKRLSDADARHLVSSCGSLPIHWRDWSEFQREVFSFIVEVFVYSRERDRLVMLLATRFPLRVGNWPIEFYFAQQGRLNDPILILGEAYSKSRVPEVRHDIAAAVRRAFGGLGIPGKDDSDFVANATQWYDREKEHLAVDSSNSPTGYFDENLPLEPEEGSPGQYEQIWSHKHSLFLIKRNVEQPGSRTNQPDQPKSETPEKSQDGTSPQRKDSLKAEDELAKLNGAWEVIEVISNGEPVPREKIKGARAVFRNELLEWFAADGEKDQEFRVRLGAQKEPPAIDLLYTSPGAPEKEQTTALVYELREETTAAIYELKGDILRMCIPRRGAWQRPTSFKSEKGSGDDVILLKRANNPLKAAAIIGLLIAIAAIFFGLRRKGVREALRRTLSWRRMEVTGQRSPVHSL